MQAVPEAVDAGVRRGSSTHFRSDCCGQPRPALQPGLGLATACCDGSRSITLRLERHDQLESVRLFSHNEIVEVGYARSSSRNAPRPTDRSFEAETKKRSKPKSEQRTRSRLAAD